MTAAGWFISGFACGALFTALAVAAWACIVAGDDGE